MTLGRTSYSRVGENSFKDIITSSWFGFEGLKLQGENKGRNDGKGPWIEGATL